MTAKLTETELTTLAAMIHSAGNHMMAARDTNGNYIWTAGDPTRPDHFVESYNDMLEGFYALQAGNPWAKLVHVRG